MAIYIRTRPCAWIPHGHGQHAVMSFIYPIGFFLLWHPNNSIVGASAIGPVLISMESHLCYMTRSSSTHLDMAHGWLTSISVYFQHRNTYGSKTNHHRWLSFHVLENISNVLELCSILRSHGTCNTMRTGEPVQPATFPDDVGAHVDAHHPTRETP